MNVSTIEVSQDYALQKLDEYKGLIQKKRLPEDRKLEQLYKAVSKGARVINIHNAFKETGLNDKGQPKLAIARADWDEVVFSKRWSDDTYTFSRQRWPRANAIKVELPMDTFENSIKGSIKTQVPHIPPSCRPKLKLHNYHILFEVDNWEEYPTDPFLLRKISGYLYIVEVEWDLTELEASLLGSM